jgi:hypothetical protein
MSFPRDRGELSPQIYATLLLIATVKLHSGELRIPAILLESVKGGESVLHDYDFQSQELVLRCGSANANLLALPGEDKWQQNQKPASAVSPLPAASLTNFSDRPRSTLDNDRAAEIEKSQQHERLMKDLRQRRDSTMRTLFSTDLDEALKQSAK